MPIRTRSRPSRKAKKRAPNALELRRLKVSAIAFLEARKVLDLRIRDLTAKLHVLSVPHKYK